MDLVDYFDIALDGSVPEVWSGKGLLAQRGTRHCTADCSHPTNYR